MACTSCNLGLARWRHTSRGQYLCIFAAVARVENVLEAATSPSPIPLVAMAGQCEHQCKRNIISKKMFSLHL